MALVKLEETLAPILSPSGKPLRIAQIAPLYESVPPNFMAVWNVSAPIWLKNSLAGDIRSACWPKSWRTITNRFITNWRTCTGKRKEQPCDRNTIHDVALAREAARQWHRVPEGDRFNTRAKAQGVGSEVICRK